MEPTPIDRSQELGIRLQSMSKYGRKCREANGETGSVMLAVIELLQVQFDFDFEEAWAIVQNSQLFDAEDSAQVTFEKAAIAPLLLMDMYMEGTVSDAVTTVTTRQQLHEEQSEVERITDWYSDMAAMACGLSMDQHTVDTCCADGMESKDMTCQETEACPLRVVRTLLLDAALQPCDTPFYDDDSARKWQITTNARLMAAHDCEFITAEQKIALDAKCQMRVAQPRGQW